MKYTTIEIPLKDGGIAVFTMNETTSKYVLTDKYGISGMPITETREEALVCVEALLSSTKENK